MSSELDKWNIYQNLLSANLPREEAKRQSERIVKEMTSRHDLCPDKHTPQTPDKDDARRWGLGACDRRLPCLTVSPGALGAFAWMGWKADIWVCDICLPCIENADWLRSRYTSIPIRKPLHMSVQSATRLLVPRNVVPIIDMDLAFKLPNAMPILTDVLGTLMDEEAHTRVFLTYVNYRDSFGRHGDTRRTKYIKDYIRPYGATHVDTFNYSSVWSNEHHHRSRGSCMAVAEIRI